MQRHNAAHGAKCRVPKLDEFLIVMQNILKSPEVHAALSSSEAPAQAPRRAAPVLSTASSVTAAPSRLSKPPSIPGDPHPAALPWQLIKCIFG